MKIKQRTSEKPVTSVSSHKRDSNDDYRPSKGKKGEADSDEALWTESEHESEIDDEEDDEPEYEVEEIINKKIKKDGVYYFVKWRGFGLEDATWEPEENLDNAPMKIVEYNQRLEEKNKAKGEGDNQKKKEEKGQKKEGKSENLAKISAKAVELANKPESVNGKRSRETFNNQEEVKSQDAKEQKKKKDLNKKNLSPESDEIENMMLQNLKAVAAESARLASNTEGFTSKLDDKIGVNSQFQSVIGNILDKFQEKNKETQPETKTDADETKHSLNNHDDDDEDVIDFKIIKNSDEEDEVEPEKSTKNVVSAILSSSSNTVPQPLGNNINTVNNGSAKSKPASGGAKNKTRNQSEHGSLEKGDIPSRVFGIRPVKEENDLEVLISWKVREDGAKPINSKVMRIEMLKRGFWLPLIEFYESKMKLENAPAFNSNQLPQYQ